MNSRRTLGRTVAVLGATTAMMIGGSAGAFAHECYVASRSAQGDAMAGSHSQAWETYSLEFIVTNFLGQSDPNVVACVLDEAAAAGVPSTFTFGGKQAQGQEGVIAENNPNMTASGLAADGHGIDHAEDAYGGELVGMILDCGGTPPQA